MILRPDLPSTSCSLPSRSTTIIRAINVSRGPSPSRLVCRKSARATPRTAHEPCGECAAALENQPVRGVRRTAVHLAPEQADIIVQPRKVLEPALLRGPGGTAVIAHQQ